MSATTILESARTLPIAYEADVAVLGGGPAGLAAAVAAAREGARVILVEKNGYMGGNATAGLLSYLIGMYASAPTPDGTREQVVHGITQEVVERLDARGATYRLPRDPNVCFDPEDFKTVADDLAAEAGVHVVFHSWLAAAVTEGDTVHAAVLESKSGRRALRAAAFVDATGDADLTAFAGAPFEKGHVGSQHPAFLQPVSTLFRVGNVDEARWTAHIQANPGDYKFKESAQRAIADGFFDGLPRGDLFYAKLPHAGDGVVSAGRVLGVDGTDADDLTRAEQAGRRQVWQILDFLRRYAPGFKNAFVSAIAPQVGIRETRRILGQYVLTGDDVVDARRFPDTIARSGSNIDIHNPSGRGIFGNLDVKRRTLSPGGTYDIPYRSLVPRGLTNVLAAGRCISADYQAHGSTRLTAQCMSTGQAAGIAAERIAAGSTAAAVNVRVLQERLVSQGANLLLPVAAAVA